MFGNIFDQGENGGGERKDAFQEQPSWGSSRDLASDKPTLALRALLLVIEVSWGVSFKLSA